jgi:hypothetical protein
MRDRAFGEWLVKESLLREDGLRRALEIYKATEARFDSVLLDLGLIHESTLLEALGRFHKTRTVSRNELSLVGASVARMVSPRIATRLRIVPFRLEGKTLSVAALDPGDLLVEDELGLITGCLIASYVTLEVRLVEALHRLYRAPLSIQYQSLIRRADAKPQTSDPAASVTISRTAPAPVANDDAPRTERRRPGDRPKRHEKYHEPLEMSDEDLHLFPSMRQENGEVAPEAAVPQPVGAVEPPAADLSPEERLAATALALQNAEMREDIGDAVLGFCAPLFRRRMMAVVRGDTVMGWRGEGDGVDPEMVRAISIPLAEPSVFVGLIQGAEFWLGPLPEMPHNMDIVAGLGGLAPKECLILPVRVRSKTVCFLYCDNVDDGVAGLPMADLRRLAAKASLAFQVYLMKSKIRNL